MILTFVQNLSKYIVDPQKGFLKFVILDSIRKGRPKSFLHWKVWLYFQRFMFSTTSLVLQKWSYNFHSNCQNTLWTLKNCPVGFLTLDNTRKKRPESFVHWKGRLLFQNFVSSTTTKVLNNWSFNFHSKCPNTLWTLEKFFSRFDTLENTRKNGPKNLSPWKQLFFESFVSMDLSGPVRKFSSFAQYLSKDIANTWKSFLIFAILEKDEKNGPKFNIHWKYCHFFSKKLCFQQPLSCYRNGLITSTVFVRLPCGPLKTAPWGLSHSIIWEKTPKSFFLRKDCLFLSKNCDFNNPSGPKQMTSLLPQ